MNHKFNTFDRCEKCGILKSSANASQVCVSREDDSGLIDTLVSATTMATFASLFEPSDSSSSDGFSAGGGDFGGGGASGDI